MQVDGSSNGSEASHAQNAVMDLPLDAQRLYGWMMYQHHDPRKEAAPDELPSSSLLLRLEFGALPLRVCQARPSQDFPGVSTFAAHLISSGAKEIAIGELRFLVCRPDGNWEPLSAQLEASPFKSSALFSVPLRTVFHGKDIATVGVHFCVDGVAHYLETLVQEQISTEAEDCHPMKKRKLSVEYEDNGASEDHTSTDCKQFAVCRMDTDWAPLKPSCPVNLSTTRALKRDKILAVSFGEKQALVEKVFVDEVVDETVINVRTPEEAEPGLVEVTVKLQDGSTATAPRHFEFRDQSDEEDLVSLLGIAPTQSLTMRNGVHMAGVYTARLLAVIQHFPSKLLERTTRGRGLLHCGVRLGLYQVVNLLLQAKVSVSPSDFDGRTPLHMAARKGDLTMASLLLLHSASTAVKDGEGKTPLQEFPAWWLPRARSLKAAASAGRTQRTPSASPNEFSLPDSLGSAGSFTVSGASTSTVSGAPSTVYQQQQVYQQQVYTQPQHPQLAAIPSNHAADEFRVFVGGGAGDGSNNVAPHTAPDPEGRDDAHLLLALSSLAHSGNSMPGSPKMPRSNSSPSIGKKSPQLKRQLSMGTIGQHPQQQSNYGGSYNQDWLQFHPKFREFITAAILQLHSKGQIRSTVFHCMLSSPQYLLCKWDGNNYLVRRGMRDAINRDFAVLCAYFNKEGGNSKKWLDKAKVVDTSYQDLEWERWINQRPEKFFPGMSISTITFPKRLK